MPLHFIRATIPLAVDVQIVLVEGECAFLVAAQTVGLRGVVQQCRIRMEFIGPLEILGRLVLLAEPVRRGRFLLVDARVVGMHLHDR